MGWQQPAENSIESLCEAMRRFDGIEFDLRLCADGDLLLHHDPKTTDGRYIENHSSDDFDFPTFSQLLEQDDFVELWVTQARFGCIEIKPPHPKAVPYKKHHSHMVAAMKKIESQLREKEIPAENSVYFAFHKGLHKVAQQAQVKRGFGELRPWTPQWGTSFTKRIRAFPWYATHSFASVIRGHQRDGASLLPCSIDYLRGWQSWVPFGRRVGLKGKSLTRLQKIRNGFPTFVWPTPIELEDSVLAAGLSPLTDFASPELSRNERPATLHEGTDWVNLNESEKSAILSGWNLPYSEHLPLATPRLIGHRGCGKTHST